MLPGSGLLGADHTVLSNVQCMFNNIQALVPDVFVIAPVRTCNEVAELACSYLAFTNCTASFQDNGIAVMTAMPVLLQTWYEL